MEGSNRVSPFKSGHWVWDECLNGLVFVSREMGLRSPSVTATTATMVTVSMPVPNEIKFRETIDALEQIKFRRRFQRRVKPNEPDVVTIQDVKDVTLFMANLKDVSTEFINYFHIPTMDRFLRSLVIYFQYYIQVWENLMLRREEEKVKVYQPVVTVLEDIVRDDLADLRSMVAKEYASILIGAEDARTFHHMNNKNNSSLSDKDRRIFETLMCIIVRVIWIALNRKHLALIELELNRILRTDSFNSVVHRGIRGGVALNRTSAENRILVGTGNKEERTLLQRSPVIKELLLVPHDHRILGIGVKEFQPYDERLTYLEAAYSAPEEELISLGITVGLLGRPRSDFDAMLMTKERTNKNIHKHQHKPAPFKLPPRVNHDDEEMPKTYPEKPPRYSETQQTVDARRRQHQIWKNRITKATFAADQSVLDLTIFSSSRSHTLMSSVSVEVKPELP